MANERTTVESVRIGKHMIQTVRRIEADGSESVSTGVYQSLDALIDPLAFERVFGSDRSREIIWPPHK